MGLGILLSFVGLKMLAHHYLALIGFGTLSSLAVIIGILVISIGLSLAFPEKNQKTYKEEFHSWVIFRYWRGGMCM